MTQELAMVSGEGALLRPDWDTGRDLQAPGVDLEAAERAAGEFLAALGIDIASEDLRETPARMARAFAELFDAKPFRMTTFPNEEGYDELVLARAIPFRAVCEHHLLPFPASPMLATCPESASWACPSWPGWSSTSRPGRRPRSG